MPNQLALKKSKTLMLEMYCEIIKLTSEKRGFWSKIDGKSFGSLEMNQSFSSGANSHDQCENSWLFRENSSEGVPPTSILHNGGHAPLVKSQGTISFREVAPGGYVENGSNGGMGQLRPSECAIQKIVSPMKLKENYPQDGSRFIVCRSEVKDQTKNAFNSHQMSAKANRIVFQQKNLF